MNSTAIPRQSSEHRWQRLLKVSRIARTVVRDHWPIPVSLVLMLTLIVFLRWTREPQFVNLVDLKNGALNDSQKEALRVVSDLNSYITGLATLMFGGLGWYLTQYKALIRPAVMRLWFFLIAEGLAGAFWYGFRANAETAAELSQEALAMAPGHSRVFYYLELQFACAVSSACLILFMFAFAVSHKRRSG